MAKLLVHENAGVRELEIVDAEVHIGRELDNTLRLPDPSISRHHCVIRKTAVGYEVQDLQSSNGVLLNGSRVQSSPLHDGDRVTLGQVQLTFVNPAEAGQGATVAMSIPQNPLGTVRMTPDQMAAIHGGAPKPPAPAAPQPPPTNPIHTEDVPVPIAMVPPPPPAPMAPPPAPAAMAAAPMAGSGDAPEFGHFTGLTAAPNPAPAFLQPYLPPLPDNAKPTGERGDFGTRLIAYLIDMAPIVVIYLGFFIIMAILARFTPGLAIIGCALYPIVGLGALAYGILFLPWCWSKFGASPGKKIMKLRIVPEDNPYGRIDFGTAILRMIGHICNFTFGYLLILGSERKAVQDYISKSICIKVDK